MIKDFTFRSILSDELIRTYVDKVDVSYAYNLAVELTKFRSNEALGFRTVGSDAEHETCDYLENEMKSLGLENIETYDYPIPSWTFKHAKMRVSGLESHIELSAYPCHYESGGYEPAVLIDLGKSDKQAFLNHDVTGKWVLLDVNQRDDWWINFPATEAYFRGAKGILLVQDGGYAEISDEALNVQNTSIPYGAVALSISRKDAQLIRSMMREKSSNELKVELDVCSLFEASYARNLFGSIIGESDEVILMTAHYDAYFEGFQDNSVAVGLMMGIAKAIKKLGILPKKTLKFGALSAEEWAKTDSRYDWLVGSHTQMSELTPEWNDTVFANINFELPAMLEDGCDWIRSSYELRKFLEDFVQCVPNDRKVYPEGIKVLTPIETWSDDFAFEIAGIPSVVSALKPEFSKSHYHSQLDDISTYHEGAFHFHHVLYGLLMLGYDSLSIQPLDYSERIIEMDKKLDRNLANNFIDMKRYDCLIDNIQENSKVNWDKMLSYQATEASNEFITLQKKLFKLMVDTLISLSWDDEILFPFEGNQNNIRALKEMLQNPLADNYELISRIDNNHTALHWSKDTFDFHTNDVMGQGINRRWGEGRIRSHCSLLSYIDERSEITLNKALIKEYCHYEKELVGLLKTLRAINNLLVEINSQ